MGELTGSPRQDHATGYSQRDGQYRRPTVSVDGYGHGELVTPLRLVVANLG
ncbi:hypothetical protein [Massilia sp. MS-15]|uniref:hypothetical protein n=1 Tax=Massilia sp. MS-15 TaxID=2878200 RepID=UPI001CD58C3C|nr:hypothetical protein [Massilia sp. MS-15]MCA1247356.1 hypothetical protein [Massilia sp. MS-15]